MRFGTAAGLVNELGEAKHQLQLRRVLARWSRYGLIAIDEVAYVPLAEVGAEFLFQVVAERATNLPFSEWTQLIPNARLCKALLDRITDRAHILETGSESYRLRRTAEKQKKGAKSTHRMAIRRIRVCASAHCSLLHIGLGRGRAVSNRRPYRDLRLPHR